jgi:hypothetical protein
MSHDPEDDQPEVELGRRFTFRGDELAPYSFNHRAALLRMGLLTDYEFCVYLIRVLLMKDLEVDAIREPEEVAAFRVATGKWADDMKISRGEGMAAIQKLADQIIGAVSAAEAVQVAPSTKKKKAGVSSRRASHPAT